MTTINSAHAMSIAQRCLRLVFSVVCVSAVAAAVQCFDCVGDDCVGAFCEGEYCVVSKYAPRWGTAEWGEPRTIKGCMSGNMLRKDVRSHCEASMENGMEVFTCFCNEDYCNSPNKVGNLEIEAVELYTCVCDGAHCKGKTCIGELCSYVVNHKNKKTEQGCVNASIPLIERRTAGACMLPPITGAMHHTIAKDAEDLLNTESCICASNYCNAKKPVIKVEEKMTCETHVRANLMGVHMVSRNISCTGEFCFKVNVTSELGHMRSFKTIGCVSFVDDAELAEELNPTGCAKFESEKVSVESCFMTNDKAAINRAKANMQRPHKAVAVKTKHQKARPVEAPYELEPAAAVEAVEEEEEEEKEEKEKEKEKEEEEEKEREEKPKHGKHHKEPEKEEVGEKTENFIFQGPTEAPVPEDSNTTLVAVFVVIMIIIVIAGVIWKFELHKKLFRANYDTVAGG